MSSENDIVIVGGGIIGCAAARELAVDHDVLVLEGGQIAGDASGKASGVVSFSAQRSSLPEPVRYSLEFFSNYEGTEAFEFHQSDFVELVPPENESQARSRAEGASEAGFPITFLDTDEVEERYPGVFDLSEYVGVIESRDTGWVDPYTCTMSYKADAEAQGADVLTNTTVTEIEIDGTETTGVNTEEEFIQADHVVVAAGWRTRELLSGIVEIPVRPMRYQTVNLAPSGREIGEGYPMGAEPGTGFYWRPEHNNELHLGGDEYIVEDAGAVRETVKESFKRKVATAIPAFLEGFDGAEIVGEDTCTTGDAATPDALPVLDSLDSAEGLTIATGFHGYGIMSSPVGGRAVRSLVTGETAPFSLEPYAIDRFEDRSTDFGLVSLAEKRAKHH